MRHVLDDSKQLISDLWLDQPDAHARIEQRVRDGGVSAADGERLRHFADEGYLMLPLGFGPDLSEAFEADITELWRSRPFDLSISGKSVDHVSFRDFPDEERVDGYRIQNLHSHSPTARELYLHPEIFRMVELIFDQAAVAFQSIYFEHGSEQPLHRDPMFVPAQPPSHLVAAWIALEDISPVCGPLLYVPGSHLMPWFEFDDDTVKAEGEDASKRREWQRHRDQMISELGLEPKPFTCKRGDVFIWHAGLLHGGADVVERGSTRKSFVVHYSTAATKTWRRGSMKYRPRGSGEWRSLDTTTDRLLVEHGGRGLDSPLRSVVEPTPGTEPRPDPGGRSGAGPAEARPNASLARRGIRRIRRLVGRGSGSPPS